MPELAVFTKEYLTAFFSLSLATKEYEKVAARKDLTLDMQEFIVENGTSTAREILISNTCVHPSIQKNSAMSGGKARSLLAANKAITKEAAFCIMKSSYAVDTVLLAKNSDLPEEISSELLTWALDKAMQMLEKQCDYAILMFLQHAVLSTDQLRMLSHLNTQSAYIIVSRNRHFTLDTSFSVGLISYVLNLSLGDLISSGALDLSQKEFEVFTKMFPSWSKKAKQLVEAIQALKLND